MELTVIWQFFSKIMWQEKKENFFLIFMENTYIIDYASFLWQTTLESLRSLAEKKKEKKTEKRTWATAFLMDNNKVSIPEWQFRFGKVA